MKTKLNQKGFHVLAVVLAIVVLGVVGFAASRVVGKDKKAENTQSTKQSRETEGADIAWMWNGEKWQARGGTPPSCDQPLKFQKSPVNIDSVESVLYPGQPRGGNYKPHGGFRFADNTNDQVTLSVPMDAKVVEGSRYIEQGETQYLLRFTTDCGISYRFDHLLTLSSKFQKIADSLPQPKVDDSRTTNISPAVKVTAGEIIATSVGFKKTGNTSVDLGVYDLRKRNQAAQNASYLAKHRSELSQAAYAICWFDMFEEKDAEHLKNLSGGDGQAGKTSDYCK